MGVATASLPGNRNIDGKQKKTQRKRSEERNREEIDKEKDVEHEPENSLGSDGRWTGLTPGQGVCFSLNTIHAEGLVFPPLL